MRRGDPVVGEGLVEVHLVDAALLVPQTVVFGVEVVEELGDGEGHADARGRTLTHGVEVVEELGGRRGTR